MKSHGSRREQIILTDMTQLQSRAASTPQYKPSQRLVYCYITVNMDIFNQHFITWFLSRALY